MTLLIANPGSTSFKCKLYDLATMQVLFQANVERIGDKEGIYLIGIAQYALLGKVNWRALLPGQKPAPALATRKK